MDEAQKELQALLQRAQALEAELRALDQMHRGDLETIEQLERQLKQPSAK